MRHRKTNSAPWLLFFGFESEIVLPVPPGNFRELAAPGADQVPAQRQQATTFFWILFT